MRSTEDFISEVHSRAEQRLKERRSLRKKLLQVGLPLAACFVLVLFTSLSGTVFQRGATGGAMPDHNYMKSYDGKCETTNEAVQGDNYGNSAAAGEAQVEAPGDASIAAHGEKNRETAGGALSGSAPEADDLNSEILKANYVHDGERLFAEAAAENDLAHGEFAGDGGRAATAVISDYDGLTGFAKALRDAKLIDASVEEQLRIRDEAFFEGKGLLMCYLTVGDSQTWAALRSVSVQGKRLTAELGLTQETGDTVMTAYLIIAEVEGSLKDVTEAEGKFVSE